MTLERHTLALALSAIVAAGAPASADEAAASASPKNAAGGLNPSETWLIIIVGHPGDREYEKKFADVADRLGRVAHDRLGIAENRIWTFSGVKETAPEKDSSAETKPESDNPTSRGPAKRETL